MRSNYGVARRLVHSFSRAAVRRQLFSSSKRSANNSRGVLISGGIAVACVFLSGVDTEEKKSHCTPVISNTPEDSPPVIEVDGRKEFSTVIIGGGTAGCTLAYLLAKWMEEMDLDGNVLLIERGHDYSTTEGPDPRLKAWFDIWGGFGEAHMTIHKTGEHYPVAATDHRGLGGCSTHDTRINFQLTRPQLERMASYMGWKTETLQTYFQAALNLIPVSRAIPASRSEIVYEKMIATMTTPETKGNSEEDIILQRVLSSDEGEISAKTRNDNEYNTVVKDNSIAEVSMSMYGNSGKKEGSDEVRYVSAYLVHEKVRPKKLKVLCNMTADRIIFENKDSLNEDIRAKSVVIQDQKGQSWTIQLSSGHCGKGLGDVVIANGSLGATGLLQRSGIGPKKTLQDADVEVIIDNAEVGHGVDHLEISLVHEWNKNQPVTRGGPTGWPLVLFSDIAHRSNRRNVNRPFPMYRPNSYFQAHFGAGMMDPNYDEPIVEMTPLVVNPDPDGGFRGHITSANPKDSLLVVNEDQTSDLEAMGHAVRKGVLMLEKMERAGLCGPRILPPPELPLSDMSQLIEWIKENHWTVYHWCSTCKAGLPGIGTVADEKFRVRKQGVSDTNTSDDGGVISNLYIGSAASLPEITEPNPHLTITAFSVALAEQLLKSQFSLQNIKLSSLAEPQELREAAKDLDRSSDSFPKCVVRREGEERPALWESVVKEHSAKWLQNHPDISAE